MDRQATRESTPAAQSDDDDPSACTLTDLLDEIERSSFKRALACRDALQSAEIPGRDRE